MRIGICTADTTTDKFKDAGFEYVEAPAARVFNFAESDQQWAARAEAMAASVLPTAACNLMLPGEFQVAGPDRDHGRILEYLDRLFEQLKAVGCGIQVFGSGRARSAPEGYALQAAMDELADLCVKLAPLARRSGVTVVMEHLRAQECNVLTTLAEAAEFVRQVNDPAIRLLVDGYHVGQMNESVSVVSECVDLIHHVHLADPVTRHGPDGDSEIAPLLKALKAGGYDGTLSLECAWKDLDADMAGCRRIVADAWDAA